MATFVVVSKVKKLAASKGNRVGKDFLGALDRHIETLVEKACSEHNGGKKTLDFAVARFICGINT